MKGQTVSLVWELSVNSDDDRPLSCTCFVNYRPLNDDAVSPVYQCKHSFTLTGCKASFCTAPLYQSVCLGGYRVPTPPGKSLKVLDF